MATNKEISVEEKLRALYDLQLIDSRIDEIKNVRGELPLEVQDLEDEVAGMNTRLEKLTTDLEVIEESIKGKKLGIESSTELIKKYTAQQDKVRNNREYNALSKEVEFQELEIQLAEKHIKEFKAQIEQKKEVVEQTKERVGAREEHLKHKQGELDEILSETDFIKSVTDLVLQNLQDQYPAVVLSFFWSQLCLARKFFLASGSSRLIDIFGSPNSTLTTLPLSFLT